MERLSQEGLEEVMEQTRKLRQKAQQLEKSRGNQRGRDPTLDS
ncbi:MAG: hypothetical protein ACUVRV_03335 [Cyanobacteriota bacterium]